MLLVEGIDFEARSRGGETPFMSAVLSENIETILLCMDYAANPLLHNSMGYTVRDYVVHYLGQESEAHK